ncbi:hypothetical protein HOG47_05455 [archaeon]|nr:hypothetical protein [archaeon]MBT4023173.1 hypothetical protein [archaeon]
MRKKKKQIKYVNKQVIVYLLLIFLSIFFFKKFFFVVLYIILNFIVLNFRRWTGIKLPIEVISFATTMAGYVYGPAEAIIVVSSSWISILFSARVGVRILFSQFLLYFLGYFVSFFSNLPIKFVGIGFLLVRYMIQMTFEMYYVGTMKAVHQIPRRIFNFVFWVFIYLSFGDFIVHIMKL